MRRSSHIAIPILAAAASGVLAGCGYSKECPPDTIVCDHTVFQTMFGGFGKSFQEYGEFWIMGAGITVLAIANKNGFGS